MSLSLRTSLLNQASLLAAQQPNDCKWHNGLSYLGLPFPVLHNGYVTDENTVMSVERLRQVLQSLQDAIFYLDMKGYKFFSTVLTQRFQQGHVHIAHQYSSGKYLAMEVSCACCCMYTCVEVNTKYATQLEMEHARAILLSFFNGCEYTMPGSNALPQR